MKYYGGRQITNEDLERALLVGMSPQERRRHEKKRGQALRNSRKCTQIEESSQANGVEICNKQAHGKNSVQIDIDVSSSSVANGEMPSADSNELNPDVDKVLKDDCIPISDPDLSESGKPMNRTTRTVQCSGDGNVSSSHNTKYSLLGHGPHGKQVVDYLLKEYGEDGIRQFCQRWRQVFVEALHPRFLPAGWDIMHRYILKLSSRIVFIKPCLHPIRWWLHDV